MWYPNNRNGVLNIENIESFKSNLETLIDLNNYVTILTLANYIEKNNLIDEFNNQIKSSLSGYENFDIKNLI